MKYRFVIVFLALALFSPQLHGEQFKYGLGKSQTVSIRVPRPPDVFVGKQDIQIIIDNAAADYTDTAAMKMAIESILQPDFRCVESQPEVIFTISIINYEKPVIRNYEQTEQRYVEVKDGDGKSKSEVRNVPIGYWEGRARMDWSIEVKDVDGVLIDSFPESYVYEKKIETSVNGVVSERNVATSKRKSFWDVRTSHENTDDSSDNGMLPLERDIERDMLQTLTKKLGPRYKMTYMDVPVMLAVPAELRPANEMLINTGDWGQALKDWQATTMNEQKYGGDRLYNIAVAYEALALKAYAESGNPEAAEPDLAKALENYKNAIALDPKEKYFKQAMGRYTQTKNNLERAKRQRQQARQQTDDVRQKLSH